LKHCIKELPNDLIDLSAIKRDSITCEGFLCVKDGSCVRDKNVTIVGTSTTPTEPSIRMNAEVVKAIAYIVLSVCSEADIQHVLIEALESTGTHWAASLDRRQVFCLIL
jgi:hypothetical protein